MSIISYRQLDVWQTAIDLVESIYTLTKELPDGERFGLICQMQRAAVSVPANIAEGWGRNHRGEYLHHLSFARGSLMELETHLILAVRLKLISKESARESWETSERVGKMLTALIMSLQGRRVGKNNSQSPTPKSESRNPSNQ